MDQVQLSFSQDIEECHDDKQHSDDDNDTLYMVQFPELFSNIII